MSFGISLSGKNTEEIYAYQWDNFSKHVSPDLQFLNKDWYSTWEHKYLPQINPNSHIQYISLFDDKDNMYGAFPYVEFSKLGLKILSVAGLYYPFRSTLFSSEYAADCAKAFVETINASHRNNIIRIGPAVEEELANRKIHESFLARGWKCYQMERGQTNVLHLPNSVDEYKGSLSKKFTDNMRRAKNKLNKLGSVEYKRFNDCSSDVWKKVIDQCASVEKRSWLAADKEAELRISENGEFWKHYLKSSDASQRVVVWLVALNGEPIAYDFAIDSGDYRYGFSSHYDEKYKKYSVGILVHDCMFEDAINNGIETIDMGDGNANYKARWGAEPGSRIVDYIYLPPNIVGRLAYAGFNLKDILQSKLKTYSIHK